MHEADNSDFLPLTSEEKKVVTLLQSVELI